MIFLSLNCQRARLYKPSLAQFLTDTFASDRYDFLVLQEVTDEVLSHLKHPGYKILTAHNEEVGKTSELCIVYRKSFQLEDSKLLSIEQFNEAHAREKSPSHGILYGDFSRGGDHLRVGSVHLHAGLNIKARRDSLRYMQQVLYDSRAKATTVLGGDHNFGPFEKKRGVQIMSPVFVCVTKNMGNTLNSRYTEHNPNNILSRVAVRLAKFGLGITLPTDHFFVNTKAAELPHTTKILPDRVSDHSPIELVLGE